MNTEKTERRKTIGLNLELAVIVSALHSVRALLETKGAHRKPLAVLGLVIARIELLRTVIRGDIDPAVAWAEHSATVPTETKRDWEDPEVKLEAWTPDVAARRLEAAVRRARQAERVSGRLK